MADSTSDIDYTTVRLKDRTTFPEWYSALRYWAFHKRVWQYIDPDAVENPIILGEETIESRTPASSFGTLSNLNALSAQKRLLVNRDPIRPEPPSKIPPGENEDDDTKASREETNKNRIETYTLQVNNYRAASIQFTNTETLINVISTWIRKTVDPSILSPVYDKLVSDGDASTHALVKELKRIYAPRTSTTQELIRQKYRLHLKKAENSRVNVDTWFREWSSLYRKALNNDIPEVQGELAVTDWLQALIPRIAPTWATRQLQKRYEDDNPPSLDKLEESFSRLLQMSQIQNAGGIKGPGVFATFGELSNNQSDNSRNSGNANKRAVCPCAKDADHRWQPTKCRRLETAITGKVNSGKASKSLTPDDILAIRQRLARSEWKDLRKALIKEGWTLGNLKANNSGNSEVVAAAIETAMFLSDNPSGSTDFPESVFDLLNTFDKHPLSDSTILDSGASTHLVNDEALLVPGSFKLSPRGPPTTIEAGTQSLPVKGEGERVLKGVFKGSRKDLRLTKVKVIEGFHVNIVSQRLLSKAGIWYFGYDDTLRTGDLASSTIEKKLHCVGNLLFIEYKPRSTYSQAFAVMPTRPSYINITRTDSEDLWHLRAGHLGQEALKRLVEAAQGVKINGTPRRDCEHCSVAHTTAVVSRRPKEPSPRPFYRISWDLFDMPTGHGNNEWALIIKDDFSGKIWVYPLLNKGLDGILDVFKKFSNWVKNKYRLSIVVIHQDGDTATVNWRGQTKFDDWAEEEGIERSITPSDTHEPNGPSERAGKEVITKGIAMSEGGHLPKHLWPDVLEAAAWLHAMSPAERKGWKTPNEVLNQWFQSYFKWYQPALLRSATADLRPDWTHTYAYGCRAYPLNKDRAAGRHKREFKVNPRGHIGYLVGYRASNIYRIWIPTLDRVITTRNVVFDERTFFVDKSQELPREEAVKVADALDEVHLLDPGEAFEGVLVPQELEDEARGIPSQQTEMDTHFGGDDLPESVKEAGQASSHQMEGSAPLRADRLADDQLEIRNKERATGLETPETTPEPGSFGDRHMGGDPGGRRHERRVRALPGGAPSSSPSERYSQRSEFEIPIATSSSAGRDSTQADRVANGPHPKTAPAMNRNRKPKGAPPTRESGRLRKRRDDDQDDQLGGGGNKLVLALIGDIEDPDDPMYDYARQYYPRAIERSKDVASESSYTTATETVMAAILGYKMRHSTPEKRLRRDDLPPPPTSWKQFTGDHKHPLTELFKEASRNEIELLKQQNTWEVIDHSKSPTRPLPLKWVWSYKFNEDGILDKIKARIVVRGDLQKKDSLQQTYAATLAAKSFRAAMAIAAEFDLEVYQYDVVGAFLNAYQRSNSSVTVELPDGFKIEGKCAKLSKALYGLRDSPLLWYKEFSDTLLSIGLEASNEEPCLFFNKDRTTFVLFYVDDILLLFHKDAQEKALKLFQYVLDKYTIKFIGPVNWFLGVRVIRDRAKRTIALVHDTYIEKVTKKFGLHETNTFPVTPLPSEELVKSTREASKQEIHKYQERVGSVLYTAIMIRPDIAHSTSLLSRFLTNPSEEHFKAVNHLIVYLWRTRHQAIVYGGYNGPALTVCCDASYADDLETRKSSYGYIILLFGGAIVWKAARQPTVTTSTTEAELLALSDVAKESMALKRFFNEIQLDVGVMWKIFCDNAQTIRLVIGENERIQTKLRHVDIRNMWLRQEYQRGSFDVEYLATAEMPADGLTKNLTKQQFKRFKDHLNLQDFTSHIEKTEESQMN
jgi:hypothetical protein